MSTTKRTGTHRLLALLIVVVGVLTAETIVQRRASGPHQFRGVLRYPVLNIGGEGSSVKLVTTAEVFDLFVSRELRRDISLRALAGKPVVVVGSRRKAGGIERHAYNAIDVLSIALDAGG